MFFFLMGIHVFFGFFFYRMHKGSGKKNSKTSGQANPHGDQLNTVTSRKVPASDFHTQACVNNLKLNTEEPHV